VSFVVNPTANLITDTQPGAGDPTRFKEMTACPPALPGYTPARWEAAVIGGSVRPNALDLNAEKLNSALIFTCLRLSVERALDALDGEAVRAPA